MGKLEHASTPCYAFERGSLRYKDLVWFSQHCSIRLTMGSVTIRDLMRGAMNSKDSRTCKPEKSKMRFGHCRAICTQR